MRGVDRNPFSLDLLSEESAVAALPLTADEERARAEAIIVISSELRRLESLLMMSQL